MDLQPVFLRKILAHDRAFPRGAPSRIWVVTSNEPPERVREVTEAFQRAGFETTMSPPDQIAQSADEHAVLFILPSAMSAQLAAACSNRKLLSIAAIPTAALRGYVALALARRSDGRVEIILNRAKALAEGHEFSPELLSLARVVE
jgi:hypothetical protein